MVLAELAGLIAQRLEHGGQCDGLVWYSHVSSGLAHCCQPGAKGYLAGDKVGAPCGAARLSIVIGEKHAFSGELVEVRRLTGHDSSVIGAYVEPTNVVTHDYENVRWLGRSGFARMLRHRRHLASPSV